MIPVRLIIQGLYSYQKKQIIDFTKLTASHLFGIFGPVGSGKSSILEAITFALYGKTDRLNLSGDNRNYNMMNLKSNELLIDFLFETGKEQTAFRALVRGRRNKKRFDDVKTLERTAYQRINGTWMPIEISALEEVIGLSYENFKRTIIIPQGKFQEFLQLGHKDRTRMMKELFNLQKFELFPKVISLESKNSEQIQNIRGQLQQLGDTDPEMTKIYEEQLIRLKKEINDLDKNIKDYQEKESGYRKIKELANKLDIIQNKVSGMKEKEPEFLQLEEIVTKYEKCVAMFSNILESLNISDKKIRRQSGLIKDDSQKLKLYTERIAKYEDLLSKIKADHENREVFKQRAEELEKLIKIKELDKKIKTGYERLEKGNNFFMTRLLKD